MVRKRSLGLAAALLAQLAAGCAMPSGSGDPSAAGPAAGDSAGSGLIGGDVAPKETATSVLLVDNRCTAARIGERHLLLAAHCVLALSSSGRSLLPILDANYKRGGKIEVTDSNDVAAARYRELTVVRTHVHPAWLSECGASGCAFDHSIRGVAPPDIAVIETVESPPGTIATVDTGHVASGDPLMLVGYGCEETLNDPSAPRRLKYAMTEAIDASSSLNGFAQRAYFETGGVESEGAASLCPGDSGGPVFRAGSGARIVGINAYYTFGDESGISETNLHTRIGGGTHAVDVWLERVLHPGAPRCEGLLTLEAPNMSAFPHVKFESAAAFVRASCVVSGSAPTAAAIASEAARMEGGSTVSDAIAALLETSAATGGVAAGDDADFVRGVWFHAKGTELGADWEDVYTELLRRGDLTREAFVALVADSDDVRADIDMTWL
jgi:hypothetical protein